MASRFASGKAETRDVLVCLRAEISLAVLNGCSMGGETLAQGLVGIGHKMCGLQGAVGPTGLQF